MIAAATCSKDEQHTIYVPYKAVLCNTFSIPMKVYFEDNILHHFNEDAKFLDSNTATIAWLGTRETTSP